MVVELGQMASIVLDYHFGWRWLLPAVDGDRIFCVGLTADEKQWWAQMQLPWVITDKDDHADGLLVALDRVDTESIVDHTNSVLPHWVCAYGFGEEVSQFRSKLRGFAIVREYALLPGSNPRVVVPLSSPRSVERGLRLHRPGRWMVRLGLLVARGLARLGYYGLLRRRVLLVASRESVAMPQGLVQGDLPVLIPSTPSDFVLYLGTADDNRKTVVLPLADTPPMVILKVAESTKACKALENESQALIAMSQTSLAERVPKLIGLKKTSGGLTLMQEYREQRSISQSHLNAAVKDFLVGMSGIGCEQVPIEEWFPIYQDHVFAELTAEVRAAAVILRKRLEDFAENDGLVWVHRCHGDLAPWNCAWSDKGLFVFDWEESREKDLGFGDAFYYSISPYVHVHKEPDVKKVLVKTLHFAGDMASQSGLDKVDVRVYLALWLIARVNLANLYGELLVFLERDWR